jgi:hypothetical protein
LYAFLASAMHAIFPTHIVLGWGFLDLLYSFGHLKRVLVKTKLPNCYDVYFWFYFEVFSNPWPYGTVLLCEPYDVHVTFPYNVYRTPIVIVFGRFPRRDLASDGWLCYSTQSWHQLFKQQVQYCCCQHFKWSSQTRKLGPKNLKNLSGISCFCLSIHIIFLNR